MSEPRRSGAGPGRWAVRAAAIAAAAGVVAWGAWRRVGPPALSRVYRQNEIARFAPHLRPGVVQFLGETFLLALVAYAARRWLKVRL